MVCACDKIMPGGMLVGQVYIPQSSSCRAEGLKGIPKIWPDSPQGINSKFQA